MQTQTLNTRQQKQLILISLSLIIMTLAVFWPASRNDFIIYDDPQYITDNDRVQDGLTLEGLIWAFTTFHASNWHPLTWLSHMLDIQIYGLNPAGHHSTSVILHTINVVLIFLLLLRMTGTAWKSASVAALFAIHPLHVESVAWVAERKDVLSAFFLILTIWAYVRYLDHPRIGRYLLLMLSFALGLMSKPMLVTLPFVLLLLDFWPLARLKFEEGKGFKNALIIWRLIREKIPLFGLSVASSAITFLAQLKGGSVIGLETVPLKIRLENSFVSYVRYIFKLIWPHDLAVYYPYLGYNLPLWQVIGSGILILLISFLVLIHYHDRPYLSMGWFWYLGTLLPVIGWIQLAQQGIADRYTYIPFIGLFIILAWGLPDGLHRFRHRNLFLWAITGISILFFSSQSWVQLNHWSNSITLFEHTLQVTDNNDMAHTNLGIALENQGKIEEAIGHYTEALRINPNHQLAHNNFGNALAHLGQMGNAIHHYSEALRIQPDYPSARYNIAVALSRQGRIEEAIDQYNTVLQSQPNYIEAHFNLGLLLVQQGEFESSVSHFMDAIKIRPDHADARLSLGLVLAKQEDLEKAAFHLSKALENQPENKEILYNLATVLYKQGRNQEAVVLYSQVLEIAPDYARVHNNLGNIYRLEGNLEQAVLEYQLELQLHPEDAIAHNNLAITYKELGRMKEAIREYQVALAIKPDYAKAHYNLGNAYRLQGNFRKAVLEYETAVTLNPNFIQAFYSLAVVNTQLGRLNDARRQYKKILEIRPDFRPSLKALESLSQ